MTTSVKIRAASHDVKVNTYDRVWDSEAKQLTEDFYITGTRLLKPGDPEIEVYATTTREIRVVDIEPDPVA